MTPVVPIESSFPPESDFSQAASPKAQTPVEEDDTALPAVGRVWEGAGPTSVFAAFKKASAAKPPASSTQGPSDSSELGQLMAKLRRATQEQQPTIAGFLDGGRITGINGGMLTLEYPKHLEVSARMLDRNGKRESLQDVLAGLLGQTVGVRFSINENETAPPPAATPAETQRANWKPSGMPVSAAPEPAVPSAAVPQNGIPITEELRVELLQQNPLIKTMAERFNARVVKVEEPTLGGE